MSLGATSAANAMIELLRNMIRPAQALRRIFVVEVMGRYSGYLALQAALGIGADAVIIPEKIIDCKPPDRSKGATSLEDRVMPIKTENNLRERLEEIAALMKAAFAADKRYGFVILAEGINGLTEEKLKKRRLDGPYVQKYLKAHISKWGDLRPPDVRVQVLGYPVRGVPPCGFDIWLGARLGAAAVQCLLDEKTNVMVGWSEEQGIIETPFGVVVAKSNRPPKEIWKDRPKWQELLDLQEALACPPTLRGQLKAKGNRFC